MGHPGLHHTSQVGDEWQGGSFSMIPDHLLMGECWKLMVSVTEPAPTTNASARGGG